MTWKAGRFFSHAALVLVALALAAAVALWVTSTLLPFPEQLAENGAEGRRILDRDGRLLARQMSKNHVFSEVVAIDDTPSILLEAVVAAEDQRFFTHPGVDPISIARAAIQSLLAGRVVSGASTITQQLARQTFDRPRTLRGKWLEMAQALGIERRLEKRQILERYLNSIHFGPQLSGVKAGADHYFGKPLAALDLSEVATLVGLIRGPSVFDPTKHPERALDERNRVLERLIACGKINHDQLMRAKELALSLRPSPPLPGAHHWVRTISQKSDARVILSTLHGPLQRQVEALVAGRRSAFEAHHTETTSAAVVVIDNQSADVLAYVGSPEFKNRRDHGENDGVQAARQPGSTLKPFIYSLAIDELGFTLATELPDEPKHFRTANGFYSPRNFDRKFRSSVRLRRALANSLNVPAVFTLEKLGETHVLHKLRELGLETLNREADHYGPALALGDGEVTLLALAEAYAALARGGLTLKARLVTDAALSIPKRVFSPVASALISEVLSDQAARRESFGEGNALELPFPVAAKTGTSKGFRDTWTVGYTRRFTVAVWAGNFDGRPTDRMTGASAAGPLFHEVMRTVVRLISSPEAQAAQPLHDIPLVRRRICLSQSDDSTESCSQTFLEYFAPESAVQADMLGATARAAPPAVPKVDYPKDGMSFRYDPSISPDRQVLVLKSAASGATEGTIFYVNGQPLATQDGQAHFGIRPGRFELFVESSQGRSEAVSIFVN